MIAVGVVSLLLGIGACLLSRRSQPVTWVMPWQRWTTYGRGALLYGLSAVTCGVGLLVAGLVSR